MPEKGVTARNTLQHRFGIVFPLATNIYIQGLQILLMSGVTGTSASQVLESCWKIWSQVSQRKKSHFQTFQHVLLACITIVMDTRSSCGGPLTWKAQIHDGGHRVNFDRNLPSSCFVVQYHSLILMI